MRLCIIGNSHAACLKKAWDRDRDGFPGVDLAFFATHASTIVNTAVDERRIVALNDQVRNSFAITSGGQDAIEIDRFDAIVLYGFGQSLAYMTRMRQRMEKYPWLSEGFRRRGDGV